MHWMQHFQDKVSSLNFLTSALRAFHIINTPYVSKWMSFNVCTHILRNTLIKRKRDVILPNYPNQLLVCFSLKKK